ncbi:MAG: SusD/RagB family nutrient-binding outer membrane lipoprotein [Bacteroidia bacterium]
MRASMDAWGVGDAADEYLAGAEVAYDGTLAQIMTQKWISNWTAAAEAWFDFRRTGLPALVSGVATERPVLPVRFAYSQNELDYNPENANQAVGRLEATSYGEGNDEWAKMWVLQGTGKPW